MSNNEGPDSSEWISKQVETALKGSLWYERPPDTSCCGVRQNISGPPPPTDKNTKVTPGPLSNYLWNKQYKPSAPQTSCNGVRQNISGPPPLTDKKLKATPDKKADGN